jgi:3-phenylpropionate/trans-cinnamate dioxygenase ferredoxin reductase subunit
LSQRIDFADDGKTVKLSDGTSREYGCLLIATGATPIRLDVPGGDRVAYLRTLRDCRAIIEKLGAAKTAVVIGASFIGLEVAASLVARGLKVSVAAPETLPLERVLGAELGRLVMNVHEQHGVTFRLGRKVTAVEEKSVTLDDGSRLDADLVVAGIGVRPNLQLAESAGLTLDNGLAVNEFLETSAKDVFAAGDVARWPDAYSDLRLRVEHWVVAERQGQVVARNMLGSRDRFDDIPFFWSAHYDKLSIRYIGHVERWDETKVEGDVMKMDCAVSFMAGGKRRAVATINRDRDNVVAEIEFETELLLRPPPPVTLEATEA